MTLQEAEDTIITPLKKAAAAGSKTRIPMEDAVKVAVKTSVAEAKPAAITTQGTPPAAGCGSNKPLARKPALTH